MEERADNQTLKLLRSVSRSSSCQEMFHIESDDRVAQVLHQYPDQAGLWLTNNDRVSLERGMGRRGRKRRMILSTLNGNHKRLNDRSVQEKTKEKVFRIELISGLFGD